MTRSIGRAAHMAAALLFAMSCLAPQASASPRKPAWAVSYETCARPRSDSAYAFAADSVKPLAFSHRDTLVIAKARQARACVDTALAMHPESRARQQLENLRRNLAAFASSDGYSTQGLRGDLTLDTLERQLNQHVAGYKRRPLTQTAVQGVLRATLVSQRLEWKGRVAALYEEYARIRDELDKLARVGEGPAIGGFASGYEGNVVGLGLLIQLERRQPIVAPSFLLDAQHDWRPGFELATGFRRGDIAFLPGIVYRTSGRSKLGLSGTALLLREGGLSMGFSVSTLQGVGFKVATRAF